MPANETCILFDGGKRIKLSTDTNPGNEGFKMSKNTDGSWDITIKTRISADEAKNVIFKFTELDPNGEPFEDVFPNMIFFPGMDNKQDPIDVKIGFDSELFPGFDRDLGGSITLKLNLDGVGKTQNVKTQNVHL